MTIRDAYGCDLYREWCEYIRDEAVKDLYRLLVGWAASVNGYTCHPQRKGVVRDVRFVDASGEQPYAFIVNRNSVLFYFRLPAVKSGRHSLNDLKRKFPSASKNARGEWRLPLRSVGEAQRLIVFAALD